MTLFRILFGIDALGLLVLLFFVAEEQRSTYGMGPPSYLALVAAVPAFVLVWAWSLRKQANLAKANKMLGLLAVPCVLGLLAVGFFTFFPPVFH